MCARASSCRIRRHSSRPSAPGIIQSRIASVTRPVLDDAPGLRAVVRDDRRRDPSARASARAASAPVAIVVGDQDAHAISRVSPALICRSASMAAAASTDSSSPAPPAVASSRPSAPMRSRLWARRTVAAADRLPAAPLSACAVVRMPSAVAGVDRRLDRGQRARDSRRGTARTTSVSSSSSPPSRIRS